MVKFKVISAATPYTLAAEPFYGLSPKSMVALEIIGTMVEWHASL